MPEYEYKCPKCGDKVTIHRSICADEATPVCLGCQVTMRRVWSVPQIDYKGDGWTGAQKGN